MLEVCLGDEEAGGLSDRGAGMRIYAQKHASARLSCNYIHVA